MTYWYRGQKVVCIDDRPLWGTDIKPLVLNQIYTVQEEFILNNTVRPDGVKLDKSDFLILEEVKNPSKPPSRARGGFGAYRFRPLDDSRLDVFKSYLNKTEAENRRELKVSERESKTKKLEDA